ncbi:hypothetical protein B0J17DRAFT_643925 [Rhizoctonia solani]|nr:hypothetical protein B0J17DRAFT_643925 [Rhizoctonia solani]
MDTTIGERAHKGTWLYAPMTLGLLVIVKPPLFDVSVIRVLPFVPVHCIVVHVLFCLGLRRIMTLGVRTHRQMTTNKPLVNYTFSILLGRIWSKVF